MSMKHLTAWEANWEYNPTFKKWWNERYEVKRGFYGETEPVMSLKDLTKAMREYHKTHVVTFNDVYDYEEYSSRCEWFEQEVGSFVPVGYLDWQRENAQKWGLPFYKGVKK